MGKIQLNMDIGAAVATLSEGVIGTARVLSDLLPRAVDADPDHWAKFWWPLIDLDDMKVYGSDVWLLYKDICGESYAKMMVMLTAVRTLVFDEQELKDMIQQVKMGGRTHGEAMIDGERFDMILEAVKDERANYSYNLEVDSFDWKLSKEKVNQAMGNMEAERDA